MRAISSWYSRKLNWRTSRGSGGVGAGVVDEGWGVGVAARQVEVHEYGHDQRAVGHAHPPVGDIVNKYVTIPSQPTSHGRLRATYRNGASEATTAMRWIRNSPTPWACLAP